MKNKIQIPPAFNVALLFTGITDHFVDRLYERNITPLAVLTTLQYGTEAHKIGAGCVALVLFDKDIPAGIPRSVAEKIKGTVVIASGGGQLITTYRNPDIRPIDLRRRYERRRFNY